MDLMEKVNLVLGGIFGGFAPGAAPALPAKNPATLKATIAELEKAGFKVKR